MLRAFICCAHAYRLSPCLVAVEGEWMLDVYALATFAAQPVVLSLLVLQFVCSVWSNVSPVQPV